MTMIVDSVQIGPINNGRQSVTLPNVKDGTYVEVVTTPQKVDEYISARKNIEKKFAARELVSLTAGTLGGVLLAALSKKGDLVGSLAIWGGSGLLTGLMGAFGFAYAANNRKMKLNEEFIQNNTNV